MTVYYNEIDTFAAAWLRNLMRAGLIPQGEVDERSILDVRPDDLRGFRQCHFFAGIAGWSRALYLAGWEETREVWTGSCPCQPLSVAGKQAGADDERHLWPAFYSLISECKPAIVFGEQVAGALGREWLAGVRTDLEGIGYACGAADINAACVGAPHIRQRLFWCGVALGDPLSAGLERYARHGDDGDEPGRLFKSKSGPVTAAGCVAHLADADLQPRLQRDFGKEGRERASQRDDASRFSLYGSLDVADAESIRRGRRAHDEDEGRRQFSSSNSCAGSFWGDWEWRTGPDGKTRRVKPGVCLLSHGIPARMGRLRGFGNAIVPQVGAEFIKAVMECQP